MGGGDKKMPHARPLCSFFIFLTAFGAVALVSPRSITTWLRCRSPRSAPSLGAVSYGIEPPTPLSPGCSRRLSANSESKRIKTSKNLQRLSGANVKSTLTRSIVAQIAVAAIERRLQMLLGPVRVLRYGGEVTALKNFRTKKALWVMR